MDKNFHMRWFIPFTGNEKAQGLNLAFEEKRRLPLEKAKFLRKPTMTEL